MIWIVDWWSLGSPLQELSSELLPACDAVAVTSRYFFHITSRSMSQQPRLVLAACQWEVPDPFRSTLLFMLFASAEVVNLVTFPDRTLFPCGAGESHRTGQLHEHRCLHSYQSNADHLSSLVSGHSTCSACCCGWARCVSAVGRPPWRMGSKRALCCHVFRVPPVPFSSELLVLVHNSFQLKLTWTGALSQKNLESSET